MVRIIYCLFFISFGLLHPNEAQITSGTIVMSLIHFENLEDLSDPKKEMSEGMKSFKMTIHFAPYKQVNKTSNSDKMATEQHFQDNVQTNYEDVFGEKTMFKTSMVEPLILKQLGVQKEELEKMYKLSYDKSDTKNILGFDCYRANFILHTDQDSFEGTVPKGLQNMSITMYITEALQTEEFNMSNMPGIELNGMPLSMSIRQGMVKMTYEALSFDDKVDPSAFQKPKGDYKEMSLEDLKMKGMGYGGFGF